MLNIVQQSPYITHALQGVQFLEIYKLVGVFQPTRPHNNKITES